MLRKAWITLAHAAADPEQDVRSGFDLLDITSMHQAARTVGELARPEAETIADELTTRYRTVKQPLRRLAKHLRLEGLEEAGPLMEALASLPKLERTLAKGQQSELLPSVPTDHLGPTWQTRVFPTEGEHAGGVDKHAWIVGTAEALRGALRRHDVFVSGLDKWGDPRTALLQGAAWENARTRLSRSLGLPEKPGVDLIRWCRELDDDYRRLAAGLADNPHVRIEQRAQNGKMHDHLVLTGRRRACSCETPQNTPIRRSPQPSSAAAAIASTRPRPTRPPAPSATPPAAASATLAQPVQLPAEPLHIRAQEPHPRITHLIHAAQRTASSPRASNHVTPNCSLCLVPTRPRHSPHAQPAGARHVYGSVARPALLRHGDGRRLKPSPTRQEMHCAR
ncbi:hypothetical protein [Streptomyces sp. NPDC004250]|uniref:hypothetical protein n=1 Tax=Streptomyces sp. NPDC004250 TaxID=3364692 RepID=UPI0036C09205